MTDKGKLELCKETGATVWTPPKGPRPLYEIAAEIRRDWKKVYFGAVPYLDAMGDLSTIDDQYFADSAKSVVRYFLANANTWKGDTARRIKAELKGSHSILSLTRALLGA